MASTESFAVPEGYTLHSENSARILLPASADAFLNPVQEFNRDLSVACIRVWGDELNAEKGRRWRTNLEKAGKGKTTKGKKAKEDGSAVEVPAEPEGSVTTEENGASTSASAHSKQQQWDPSKFTILEALSATGLRSIRYAKEIPHVKYVIANDLSPEAVVAMKRNIDLNGLGPAPVSAPAPAAEGDMQVDSDSAAPVQLTKKEEEAAKGKVRVNEGDACALMFNHRPEKLRVDVVDLDPYGTAAPFIDPAVQCVKDGGLLAVTCTDMAVLATTNYSEKCYANYGGVPVKAEYCHEAALRLVLHSLATAAARYGRYIEPLVSLSIDFYVRIFVRVRSAPSEVKKLASKTAMYYVCTGCQSFHEQPLGRCVEKTHEKSGQVNLQFKTHGGPPTGQRCSECNSTMHVAGPMWSAPIHDETFVGKVLEHLEANKEKYGTYPRMHGMLTVANEELKTPFYFTPGKLSSFFHCETPSLDNVASALLHAGHEVSRSHACPGSLKTTASRVQVHDIMRAWIKDHPVSLKKVSDNSPTRTLLAKEGEFTANFAQHPRSVTAAASVKLVRYQQNPLPNWGPGMRPQKRKRAEGEDGQP